MAHIVGDSGPNFLQGGNDHDLIQGSGGDDVLYGMAGNDTLDGGTGGDYFHGGLGLDFADYVNSAAVLVNLANNSSAGGQSFGDYFVSIEGVLGSTQGDWITGDANFNVFYGRGGGDLIDGGGGTDLIYGGEGADDIIGNDGNDDLLGGAGADDIDGGPGIDISSYAYSPEGVRINLATNVNTGGEAEGDYLYSIEHVSGSAHSDRLVGDVFDNELRGGEGGVDSISGGNGNDRLSGSGFIAGNNGNDSIFAGYFFGTVANGNDGNDYVIGGRGSDTVIGFDGNDTVSGSYMGDTLTGGRNADTFWYVYADGIESRPGVDTQDLITDFSRAERDKVDVSWVYDDYLTEDVDEPFAFIGTKGFTGKAGELRFITSTNQNATFIQADTDGNKAADLQVKFTGVIAFTAGDLIL